MKKVMVGGGLVLLQGLALVVCLAAGRASVEPLEVHHHHVPVQRGTYRFDDGVRIGIDSVTDPQNVPPEGQVEEVRRIEAKLKALRGEGKAAE